jgi:Ca-activated chloride channel family protein
VEFLAPLRALFRENVAEWQSLRLEELHFWHRSESLVAFMAFVAISATLLVARLAFRRDRRRHRLVLPAVLANAPRSYLSVARHLPLALFLAGLAFFGLALADPYSALYSQQVSYPGRRIALLIDASTSMRSPFKAETLNRRSATDAAFFTTVAAAERFVQLRIKGRYRDLMALVEFGNEAYVVTPFTNDYENILLSISLIGDPVEFSMFPDQGTIIARGIEQATNLFKAFNFLEASGNLLVIFSDGEDTNVTVQGRTLDSILESAVEARIPVYLVRTNYDRELGKIIPDDLWAPAVAKTGGRFFAASNETSLLAAIAEIDRVSAGTIQVKQYTTQLPRFGVLALLAMACWFAAGTLAMTVPFFRKFP